MALVYITRKEHFNAAHKLYRPDWSDEENEAVFGPCANKNWHGHNYEIRITVKGEPNPETGFVVDLKWLSQVIRRELIEHLDHKNLNLDVPFMEGQMSSTENLAIACWQVIKPHIESDPRCKLHCIEIAETASNSVAYYGE
jgi:6-pyruvoyltetrahydropterin/6-carboxytetrahydropterin synthase